MAQQSETTHTLMAGTLLVYQRERSAIWQCRFKVDGQWQRASTKERDLKRAKEVAKKLLITAEIRKEQNMPVDHLRDLGAWDQSLRQTRRVVDHPWNAGLMTEALVSAAKIALLAVRTGLANPARRTSVLN